MQKISIYLVDPDRNYVEDVRRRMQLEATMEIRDVAASGMEAYGKVQQQPPDAIVISTSIMDVAVQNLIQGLKMLSPAIRVIVLSHDGSADPSLTMLGASIWPKAIGPDGLIDQLRQLFATPQAAPGGMGGAIPPWGAQAQPVAPQSLVQQQPFAPQQPQQPQTQAPWAQATQPQQQAPWMGGHEMAGGPSLAGMPGATAPQAGMEQLMGQAGGYRTIRQTIVACHSAKGGVGKTTISKELSTLFARAELNGKQLRVLLVDGDFDFGDVGAMFRVEAAYPNVTMWTSDIAQKLKFDPTGQSIRYTEAEIKRYVIPDPKRRGVDLLLAPPNHADALDISGKMMEVILDNLKRADCYDVIVVDTGPNTKDFTLMALDKANYVVYITNQEYSAINDCYLELKTLRSINFPMGKIHLLVNEERTLPGLNSPQEIAHALGLPLMGTLPDVGGEKMKMINNKGEAISSKDADTFTQHLRKIAHQIMPVFQRKVDGRRNGGSAPEEKPAKKGFSLFGFGKK